MELELDLANIIKAIAYCEISIENMRIRLAENPNFDINYIFPELKTRDLITANDIVDFLSIYRVAISKREAEYIINLCSSTPNSMDFASFYKTILPKTDKSLFSIVLNKAKVVESRTYNQHFSSEVTLRSVSEREVARILESELSFYRSLEQLKKDFSRNHQITARELFKLIDCHSKGSLDYEGLSSFMKRGRVVFSREEYWALLRRIAVNLDDKIEFQELVYAIAPNEPYEYPAFRETFQSENTVQKAEKMGFWKARGEFEDFAKRKQPLSFAGSGIRGSSGYSDDLLGKERKNFIYDQSYHKEYHHYKAKFIEPSKDLGYQFQKKNLGIGGINDYFSDYYLYLSDRENSELFFNKYGKRYAYENQLDAERKKKEATGMEEKTLVDTFRYTLSNYNLHSHRLDI